MIAESNEVEGVDIGKKHKLGHLRVDQQGNMTFKRLPTNQLVQALQLGIQHAIGGLQTQPPHDLLVQDFGTIELIEFPKEGRSSHKPTPAHRFNDFTICCYAPLAFRHFREKFNIKPEDFLLSINEPWRELKNPGASGSLFYLTGDDQFIIKTVQRREASFLKSLLPGYYLNLTQNSRTLLPKFFGLFCYQGENRNIRITLMNNLVPSHLQMHEKYDLKGSTYKRRASNEEKTKESPTWKDLDFIERHPEGLTLDSQTYDALRETVDRDCRVLESFSIMDYSFLLCIHEIENSSENNLASKNLSKGTSSDAILSLPKRNFHRTPMDNIQAQFDKNNKPDDFVAQTGGIPARDENGQRLSLYIGIIDILQSYQLKKKLEHAFKSFITDGSQISVTHPKFYSERFQTFLFQRVFKRVPPLRENSVKKITKNVDISQKKFAKNFENPQNRSNQPTIELNQISPINDSVSKDSTTDSKISDYYSTLQSTENSERSNYSGSSQTICAPSVKSDSLLNEPIRPSKGKLIVTEFQKKTTEEARKNFYRNELKSSRTKKKIRQNFDDPQTESEDSTFIITRL